MFVSRSTSHAPRWTNWRIRLFLFGATLAVVGMALETEWMINVAIGILLIGFALRFVPEPGEGEPGPEEPSAGSGDATGGS